MMRPMTKPMISFRLIYTIVLAVSVAGCAGQYGRVNFSAIYFDMDRTTLTSSGQVQPAIPHTLSQYRQCGGHVGIATGRTFEQLTPFLDQIKPDLPLVLMNGAVAADPQTGSVFDARPLLIRDPCGLMKTVTSSLSSIRGVVFHDRKSASADRTSAEFDQFLRRSLISVEPHLIDTDYCASAPRLLKILFFVDPKRLRETALAIAKFLPDDVRAVVTSEETIELVSKEVNKGAMLESVLGQLGIPLSEVMAFGDNDNDVEMLKEVGFGVAMEHCSTTTCQAALVRAKSNDSDSIAQIIGRVGISRTCKYRQEMY